MTKKIFFVLILAIAGTVSVNSQVRIGGLENPNRSAVLDLNPDDSVSEGNATLGLALPRVNLRNCEDAFPLSSHVKGMTVYNTGTANGLVPGIYLNDGEKWTLQVNTKVLQDSIIYLVHANELDGVIGNEVTGATSGGGLIRSGEGTAVSPYTLGIASSGVTSAHLANNSVNSSKIADGSVTDAKINAMANIAGSKLADRSIDVCKLNADGSASATTYLRGDGSWAAPAPSGVTSVSGLTGITVTNNTTTPVISLPSGKKIGNVLKWNGINWAAASEAGITSEADGVIGNEVTDATPGGGLIRSGEGTADSPYTLGIAQGGITTYHIADNTVTGGKIAEGTITDANINVSAGIALNKIALPDAAANNGKVLKSNGTAWVAGEDNNTISENSYTAGDGLTLSGTTFSIGNGQINSEMIADGTISTVDIADNAVTSEKIANGTIKSEDLNSMGATAGQVLSFSGSAWLPKDNYAKPVKITDTATATNSITSNGYSNVYSWANLQPGLYSLRIRMDVGSTAKFRLHSDVAFGTSLAFEINADSHDSTVEVMFNYYYTGTLTLKACCTGNCPSRIANLHLFRF